MAIDGNLKLKINVNPGYLARKVMKSGLYDAYTDALLDLAQEFQENSPIGATRQLVEGWDVQNRTLAKVFYGMTRGYCV